MPSRFINTTTASENHAIRFEGVKKKIRKYLPQGILQRNIEGRTPPPKKKD
jgi:hypothetical protein